MNCKIEAKEEQILIFKKKNLKKKKVQILGFRLSLSEDVVSRILNY
jgi:hypothetical protein